MKTTIDSKIIREVVGRNIESLRLQKKKSTKEIAGILQLTISGYRNIEKGITELTLTKLLTIAEILDVHYSLFLENENLANFPKNNNENSSMLAEAYKACILQYKEEVQFLKTQLNLIIREQNQSIFKTN